MNNKEWHSRQSWGEEGKAVMVCVIAMVVIVAAVITLKAFGVSYE
jgi:hypothetical protein